MNNRARLRASASASCGGPSQSRPNRSQRLVQPEPIGQPQQAPHLGGEIMEAAEERQLRPRAARSFPGSAHRRGPRRTSRFARMSCGWSARPREGRCRFRLLGRDAGQRAAEGRDHRGLRAHQERLLAPDLEIVGLEIDDAEGDHLRTARPAGVLPPSRSARHRRTACGCICSSRHLTRAARDWQDLRHRARVRACKSRPRTSGQGSSACRTM